MSVRRIGLDEALEALSMVNLERLVLAKRERNSASTLLQH